MIVGSVGLLTTAVAIACALVPTLQSENPLLFYGRLVTSCALVVVIGWVVYAAGGRRRAQSTDTPVRS